MGETDTLLGGTVVVVQRGDVTVERRIHPSDRDGSFVTMAVRNTSDSDLSVRIQEAVSDAVDDAAPIESPDSDSSSWLFDGDRIVHEHEIAAGDDRAIIYEIKLDDDTPAMELSQPAIASVESIAHVTDGGSSDGDACENTVWRGATTGSPAARAADSGPEATSPPAEDAATSALVDRLLTELESADDDDLAALRERLGPGQSERVRLNHFRSRVDDLEAYVELLETFIDGYGRPADVVDDVRDRLDENERALRTHRSEIEHLEDAASERQRLFETTAEQFEDDIERLEREFATLQKQVEEWRDTQSQIAAALSGEGTGDKPEA